MLTLFSDSAEPPESIQFIMDLLPEGTVTEFITPDSKFQPLSSNQFTSFLGVKKFLYNS